jgi:hypothetical protein
MFNLIKKYFSLIDDLIVDFLGDLKSFRVQLIYMSYVFNLIVLWAVIFHSLDWKALTISFGTQSVIYAFYFSSKKNQAIIENSLPVSSDEPQTDRNPDAE